jgi:predicted kinase
MDKQAGPLLGSAPGPASHRTVQRVSVVGTSGSGKSTLGKALAARIGAGFLELDSVFHQPGWVPLPDEDFRRQELWNGNRERWRDLFSLDKEESVIAWAWPTHAATRAEYTAAMADPANVELRFVRLKKPAEVRRFLRSVPAAPKSGAPVSGGD